ncbi:unnamed protein product [Vitrella brassicaformis CCMP3155]|uniref:Amino acid transporter transmembrane domain-containing protein n=1 Tax=Vitrella brassicaformis (strain CCMP3155) TaxID=1169540 RepID=A0A0G4FYC6_VITBC|nr:unnamed protein product [Vitrella brassicaformis CCMP3155]|mmetsp:Transcript_21752/g.53298  ORF Transcript_21752/g.53298 Transcript_21752/m.53298 type:complete len:648 (-) Transcript_21752:96-2039(-)|eukprot:CEM20014.1 unnamed protein product [Vitrella brassicaformis CCMP3155]
MSESAPSPAAAQADSPTFPSPVWGKISPWTWFRWSSFVVVVALGVTLLELYQGGLNWHILFWYAVVFIWTSCITTNPWAFYNGEGSSLLDRVRAIIPLTSSCLPGHTQFDRRSPTGQSLSSMPSSATLHQGDVGFFTLASSAFITWIFAKSIFNSATLGSRFGMLGGVAYAGWYVSFLSAAIVGYVLRVKQNAKSLPSAVCRCYGDIATFCFELALLYRLFNEVWSNSVVVAGFYGETYSTMWWAAVITSTGIPAVYVCFGGMRTSLFSDVLQALLAIIFLVLILVFIGQEPNFDGINSLWTFVPGSGWIDGWSTLFAAALIQGVCSYPFMDPVLTDRTFLSTPNTMLVSFFGGGLVAALFIILFAAVGVYGAFLTDEASADSGDPATVASSLPVVATAMVNLVMLTSSMSTLDSTFTSTAKLFSLEFGGWLPIPGDNRTKKGPIAPQDVANIGPWHIAVGRLAIIAIAVGGSCFLMIETTALNATTVSGTMVMGLGPPVWGLLVWRFADPHTEGGSSWGWRRSPLAFLLSFVTGVAFGTLYQLKLLPESFEMGVGPYSALLGTNVIGHACCAAAFVLGLLIHQTVWRLEETVKPPKSLRQKGSTTALEFSDLHKDDGNGANVAHIEAETAGTTPKKGDAGGEDSEV